MLERFLEMQVAVFATIRDKSVVTHKTSDVNCLSDEDILLVEDCAKCLQPLKTITTLLCSEKTPTVSIIMPLQNQLSLMMAPREDDRQVIREMKKIATDDLAKRYLKIKPYLLRATGLDPRFKSLAFLSDNEKSAVYDDILTEAYKLKPLKVVKEEPAAPEEAPPLPVLPELPGMEIKQEPPPEKDPILEPVAKKIKTETHETALHQMLGDVFVTKELKPKSDIELLKDELLTYKDIASDLSTDPLMWWKSNSPTLPRLARLAKQVLCVPATSVPSERVFSTAGDIITAQRSQLASSTVDTLIFLKKNMI